MLAEICLNSKDKEIREKFTSKQFTERLVKSEDTCQKLVNILAMRKYTNGGRTDYFDK